MREEMGEFALAEKGPLPRLIEWTDLKGSLHNHSTWSDGHQRPEEIAKAMRELGLAYWAITDHSKASFKPTGWTPLACGSNWWRSVRSTSCWPRREKASGC